MIIIITVKDRTLILLSTTIFLLPSRYLSLLFFVFLFLLSPQCDGCPDVPVWGLMVWLWELLAMGTFYRPGACWSQCRPLEIPGTHLPLSVMQLLMFSIWMLLLSLVPHYALQQANEHFHSVRTSYPLYIT